MTFPYVAIKTLPGPSRMTAAADLPLDEVLSRSYLRAVPASKLVRPIRSWLERKGLNGQEAEDELATALLQHLLVPSPPALLLSYLTESLASQLVTARTVVLRLLTHPATSQIPSSTVASVASVLNANSFGLGNEDSLPPTVPTPGDASGPDVGTSASATPPPPQSTLALLLPLIRMCVSSEDSCPQPVLALVSRLVALLPPYPAPPLDVGVEASGILPVLPDTVAVPLRAALSGLMADVEQAQGAAAMQFLAQAVNGPQAGTVSGTVQDAAAGWTDIDPLPNVFAIPRSKSAMPAAQAVALLLVSIRRSMRWVRFPFPPPVGTSVSPWTTVQQMLAIGRVFAATPQEFLAAVISGAIAELIEVSSAGKPHRGERWIFLVGGLPEFLRWWKDNPLDDWALPLDVASTIKTALEHSSAEIDTLNKVRDFNNIAQECYQTRLAEAEDEDGSFQIPEGWQAGTLQECLLQRLLELGIITTAEVEIIAPGAQIRLDVRGEPLVDKLLAVPTGHLEVLATFIGSAPGAQHAFCTEVINIIAACPGQPAPEGLFARLISNPRMIKIVPATAAPATVLDLMVEHLLDPPDDPGVRANDPQGSLTRFGEAVELIEVFVGHFKLPLPDLLQKARRAVTYSEMQPAQQECMSGWAKALFGSDGIDDQILLSTAPADFCRLATSLIQQAIQAVTAGVIDLDTLHSGLSYFSQPLLSWCLGAVLSWLCAEIERQGLLAAVHLDVLQNLILANAVPEPLLRVSAEAVTRILNPSLGLEPVFTSSGFDAAAVWAKLDGKGQADQILISPPSPQDLLRAELIGARRVDGYPPVWRQSLLVALEDCVLSAGPAETALIVMLEMLEPSSYDFALDAGDPLLPLGTVCLLIRSAVENPILLLDSVISSFVPDVLAKGSLQPAAVRNLAMVLKTALLLAREAHGQAYANGLVDELVDRLVEIRQEKSKHGARIAGGDRDGDVLSSAKQGLLAVQALCGVLASDAELKEQFFKLVELR